MMQEKYPHKILIVEDEPAMANSLVDNLRSAGFGHIIKAVNGEEGLAIALKEKPDLIILDIVMPKMDGMLMLKNLRQAREGKDLKAIILTNLSADDSILQAVVASGPSYYFVKSDYSIGDVIQKVKITLGIEPLPMP